MRLTVLCASLVVALALTQQANAQLGPPAQPPENLSTPEKIVLGKILFWDEQLSSNNTVACGTCHIPRFSFTDNREFTHPGADGIKGTLDDNITSPGVVRANAQRNFVPTPLFGLAPQLTKRRTNDIFGALYQDRIFWDGRAEDQFVDPESGLVSVVTGGALETQALEPIMSTVEMGHIGRTWDDVRDKLESAIPLRLATDIPPDMSAAIAIDPTYPDLFDAAFGTPDINSERIAFAIAAYERELVPDQTPWDDFINGNPTAMTPEQIDGWNQFNGIANCHLCHTPPVFSDGDFHNNGMRPTAWDPGLQDTTGDINDRGKFKTPSLRGAGLRTSFYHGGYFQELWPIGVTNIYWGGGGGFPDNRDPLLVPLMNVPGINMENIMDFVGNALTDPRLENETFPFDKPTLFSERQAFSTNLYGDANPGATGVEPKFTAHMPAIVGHKLRVGVSEAKGGSMAHFGASGAPGAGLFRGGRLVNIAQPMLEFVSLPLPGSGDVDGWRAIEIPIPDRANLVGRSFYMQWWIDDAGAPGGVASSTQGANITIQG